MNKENRFTTYVSVRNTSNGKHWSTSIWDDVLKQATFFNDLVYTKEDFENKKQISTRTV